MKKAYLTGDRWLDIKLKRMPANVQKKLMRTATRESAKTVKDLAIALAPVDTGELQESIVVKSLKRSRRWKHLIGVYVGTAGGDNVYTGETFYGGFQEWGTKKMDANPFLWPAMDQSKGRVVGLFTANMRRIIREVTAKAQAK